MRPTVTLAGTLCSRLSGIAAVLLLATAGSPHAHGAPLIKGQNYVDSVSRNDCSTSVCDLQFTQLPVSRYLLITNVSCFAQTKNAPNIPKISLAYVSSSVQLIPVFFGNRTVGPDTYREYVANGETFFLVPSGKPVINVGTFANVGSVTVVRCTIGGLLKPN